jgi:putative nucleotidyltransferase with HDIG domain
MTFFLLLYMRRAQATLLSEPRSMAVVALLFLVFLVIARLAIPTHPLMPYVFPLAAYGLTIAALFGAELAMVSSLLLALLVTYGQPDALGLTVYYVMSSLFGVLALGRARRISSFFGAGAVIALAGAVLILAYRLPDIDGIELATLSGIVVVNGLASASLVILLQFFLAQLLGLISPMQLMDLSRPDHPLLQILLHDAPGTYQHSLQVANLAEQVAERIGADPLLTRVGTLYHDVGKTRAPGFFIENQPPGLPNPHDSLDPQDSARIILEHVTDGLELARKYRLPRRILDFIAEHHGTMLTRYQYVKAVKAAGGDENAVDESVYRYPGPRPGSRETAILMLADGSEARVRAERPPDEEQLRKLIKSVVDARVASGQLDDTGLTLRDLAVIVDSFTTTLRGMYHPRLEYPQLDADEAPGLPTESLPDEAGSISVDIPADARS